jgi:hypothetical protein
MARPKLKIDPEKVKQLAMINCSYAEIAAVLDCDESTLTRRFAQVIKKGRESGKMSLKRAMWKKAVTEGNVVMQIWLSKQMLGYTDKQTIVEDNTKETYERPESMRDDDKTPKAD